MISTYDVIFYGFLVVLLVPVLVLLVGMGWWLRLHRGLVHVGRRMGARWWDAAAPLALGTGVFLLAVLLGDVPDEGESGYLTFAFSGALLLLGIFGLTLALGNLDEYRQVANGADSAGTVDDGPAVVSGPATANGQVLAGPLSGGPSLYHTLRVTERRGIGHRKSDVEIHYEDEGVPFTVDDGTGAVEVDPTDGTVRLRDGDQFSADVTVSTDESDDGVPDAVESVREWVGLSSNDDQTFHEMRLEPETRSPSSERSATTRKRGTRSSAMATDDSPSSKVRSTRSVTRCDSGFAPAHCSASVDSLSEPQACSSLLACCNGCRTPSQSIRLECLYRADVSHTATNELSVRAN